MGVRAHRQAAGESTFRFAVITTTDSRTEKTDESGRIARELLTKAGHVDAGAALVANDLPKIRAEVRRFLKKNIDLVLVTGGTGAGPRDVSVQAVLPLLDRVLEGFGELFRMLSWDQVGSAAMLSRAVLGLSKGRAVCVTPGSPKAVRLALEKLLIPELPHLLSQARASR